MDEPWSERQWNGDKMTEENKPTTGNGKVCYIEIPAIDIEHAVRAGADGVVGSVRVFDEYRGPQVEAGKKSVAVRVVLQRDDATLTDADADKYITSILASLRERCGAKIRE